MRRRCPDLTKTQDVFFWGLTKKNIEDTIEKLAGDLAKNMAEGLNNALGANPNMAQEEEPEYAEWDDFLK